MKVNILDFSGDDPSKPEIIGTASLDHAGGVIFSEPHIMELCCQAAAPVTTDEPERFLRSLPLALSGSMLRAELED